MKHLFLLCRIPGTAEQEDVANKQAEFFCSQRATDVPIASSRTLDSLDHMVES